MQPQSSKLPLWSTVGQAYRLSWQHRREYLRISRWWLLLSVPIIFVYEWLTWPITRPLLCFDIDAITSADGLDAVENADMMLASALLLPPSLYLVVVGASIAVAWHRLILRGERISTDRYLRFDSLVHNYLIFAFFLWLLATVPSFFQGEGSSSIGSSPEMLMHLIWLIVAIIILLAVTRLSVALPAKALALDEVTIKDVWKRTRSNFWRLFAGEMLCVLPVLIILMIATPDCGNDLLDVTFQVLNMLVHIAITMPILLTFLSLAYRHFFEPEAA